MMRFKDVICVYRYRESKSPFYAKFVLEQGMTECSAWCHDQARAINGEIPTAEDLKKYIECFENY